MFETQTVIIVLLLVLLVVPTVIWFAVRRRPKESEAKVTASGIKHRWWQP